MVDKMILYLHEESSMRCRLPGNNLLVDRISPKKVYFLGDRTTLKSNGSGSVDLDDY